MPTDTPLIALLRKIQNTTDRKIYLVDLDPYEAHAFDVAVSRLDADGHPDPLVRTGLVGTPIGNVALPDPKNTLPLHLTPKGKAVLADALYADAVEGGNGAGYMSPHDIANQFKVSHDALRKRLERWRAHNLSGWVENTEAGPRDARYLYMPDAVMGEIRALQSNHSMSSERPAKKK